MKNNEIIKEIFKNEGIDEVGFAKVDYELPYAISIVIPLSKFVAFPACNRRRPHYHRPSEGRRYSVLIFLCDNVGHISPLCAESLNS